MTPVRWPARFIPRPSPFDWHPWFAWHPVKAGAVWVWLESIERRGDWTHAMQDIGIDTAWAWEYRLPTTVRGDA